MEFDRIIDVTTIMIIFQGPQSVSGHVPGHSRESGVSYRVLNWSDPVRPSKCHALPSWCITYRAYCCGSDLTLNFRSCQLDTGQGLNLKTDCAAAGQEIFHLCGIQISITTFTVVCQCTSESAKSTPHSHVVFW